MRSWLFVPADSERKITKALASQADVVILDLEDSVAVENKAIARTIVRQLLENRPTTSAKVYIRVNALDSGLTASDLEGLGTAKPDGFMLPKTNSGKDVEQFTTLSKTALPIIAITTETAASLFTLGTYANISAPLTAMTWGAEDLSSELGSQQTRDDEGHLSDPYRLARSLCLAGARAAQVEPIDTIYANFRNMAGFKRECLDAARDGFTGKMAIHPDQVALINQIFTPSAQVIEQANQIVEVFAKSPGTGVVSINGQMYDIPHLKRAEKLLQRALLYNVTN